MSAADLYEDGFPHGTKEGYERGCRGSACPNKFEGLDTCHTASMRYARDYAYRRAVDAGETPPPEFPKAETKKASQHAEERVWAEPVVTVADSAEPLPEETPALTPSTPRKDRAPKTAAVHPSPAMYQRGCRKDNECPSFLAGGISCRRARLDYVKDRAAANRAEREAAATQFDRIPVEPAAALTVDESRTIELAPAPAAPPEALEVETTVTRLPGGGVTIVIRIPSAMVVAA
jgi:hypothetical protein